jgi:RNA polymerase sigma factor (sigma-70 family)
LTAHAQSSAAEWPDEELMAAVREGDTALLRFLFERHGERLFAYLWRMNQDRHLSEDLAQEVFVRILRFRAGFKNGHSFTAWMYSIARNLQMDHWRKRRWEADWEEGFDQAAAPVAEPLAQQQESEMLHEALRRLPPAKREILILSRFQELPHEKIAVVLGCEPGAARVRLHRALASLREVYLELTAVKPPLRGEAK